MPDVSEYLSIVQAAKECPGRVGGSSVRRWCDRGILSKAGNRVMLKHIRVGGKIYTTNAWLLKFWKACAASTPFAAQPVVARKTSRSHADAKRELAQS